MIAAGQLFCSCGKPALSSCAEGMGLPMTLCLEPVCGAGGQWCGQHRHRAGTMGYPAWAPWDKTFVGDVPDNPGFFDAVKAKLRTMFKSPKQIAQMARDEQFAMFEKLAPVPDLTFRVGKRVFRNVRPNDPGMIEVIDITPKKAKS